MTSITRNIKATMTKSKTPKMNNENTNVFLFFEGSTLGEISYNCFRFLLDDVNEKKKDNFWTPEVLNAVMEQTRQIQEEAIKAYENSKELVGYHFDKTLFAVFNMNIITLVENGMIPNDENNGYQFVVVEKPKKKYVRPVHIPTVINTPVEVDRTPQNFVPKTIDVLTKAELIVLGTKLGLTGLTKKNVTELKKACMTRRTNQHFQTYIDEILCKIL